MCGNLNALTKRLVIVFNLFLVLNYCMDQDQDQDQDHDFWVVMYVLLTEIYVFISGS